MKKFLLSIVCAVLLLLPAAGRAQDDVVGVLADFYWQGGAADPIQLIAQVSGANKNTLALMMHQSLSNTEVEFIFRIFDYDPLAKEYYRSVHCNDAVLYGLIEQAGGELQWSIDINQSMEVMSPANYTFAIGVAPRDMAQEVHLAVSTSAKFVKPWGISMGKAASRAKAARTTADISKSCDVQQGFSYNRDVQSTCGFLVAMKIGSTDLAADLAIVFPDGSGSVPVELSSFTAERGAGGVALAWNTASEQGNLGFNVERSGFFDGPFERVNPALIAGAVQSAVPVDYAYMDESASRGDLYYRLQQLDLNGGVTYSPVIACDNGVAGVLMPGRMGGVTGSVPEFVQALDGRTVRTEGAAPGVYLVREGGSVLRVFKLR